MQLAVSPTNPALSATDLVAVAVEAETLGYTAAWLAEVAGPESFALAGAIANATSEIEVGIAVVPAATRSPALLAMGAGTVSSLLGGRTFRLGVGASSEFIVRDWHGRDFGHPRRTVAETVQATRVLLAGERSYQGVNTRVERFRLASPPNGPVFIHVGALGPLMLQTAGAVADGVCLNLMTSEAVPTQLGEIRNGAHRAGRELPADFQIMARFHVVLTDDPMSGRAIIKQAFGPYFAQPVYNRFLTGMGFPDEAAALAAAFVQGDRAGVGRAFSDEIVDRIALVGSAGQIAERLEEYSTAGVEVGALNMIAPDAAATVAGLRLLAPR